MDKIYQKYWNNLRVEKQAFWGMGSEITKEIPIIYPAEPDPLIGLLPAEIRVANKVIEEDHYFIFNGKKKVRKIPFLSQLLPKNNLQNIQSTSGHLFLTIDPEWILRCSDKEYTSWVSCFAPDGCYHFSAKEYTTSINIAMAMITNSDMTKIIGRKFVFIPSSGHSNIREEIVFFAKHYGTFPIHYQRSLSAYIAESVFGSNKDNWKIISKEEDCHAEEAEIYVEDVENAGNSYFRSGGDKKIWFDESAFVFYEKDANIENAHIFFDSGEEENEEEEDSDEVACEHCGDCFDASDLYSVYYRNNSEFDFVCESCLDNIAVIDNFTGNYIYLDEAVEFWHIDSRGDAYCTRYTTEEDANSNLIGIRVIDDICDNVLWEVGLLYADGVPNSCVEYNGEYLCADIEDTDNSAILELIKELEGEEDEDEEESEEIAVEAADE